MAFKGKQMKINQKNGQFYCPRCREYSLVLRTFNLTEPINDNTSISYVCANHCCAQYIVIEAKKLNKEIIQSGTLIKLKFNKKYKGVKK